MFKKLFGKKEPKTQAPKAPEIMGLRLGGAFEFDKLKLRLIEPSLIIEGVAPTQLIQAVGEVKLDENSTVLRFYTDDEGFLQVLLTGGMSENHIADVKMWYFYETKGVAGLSEWNRVLDGDISQATRSLEGHTFSRVWEGTGAESPPVAMTEKTYSGDGSVSETDQFAMLYERELESEQFEYLLVAGEEKIIDNHADRCLVTSTGFDVQAADIQIIG